MKRLENRYKRIFIGCLVVGAILLVLSFYALFTDMQPHGLILSIVANVFIWGSTPFDNRYKKARMERINYEWKNNIK